MDFAKPISSRNLTPRIQFYNEPPVHTIELEHLEQLAIERLKILKCIESVGQDFIRGSKEYDGKLSAELCKIGPIAKSFTLTSNQPKNLAEDIHNDVTSHFILQIAYCRSETMRRWFIQQELDLFRYRFNLERAASGHSMDTINEFLRMNNLHFARIDSDESLLLREQLISGTNIYGVSGDYANFYKVHFTEVLDLVRRRQVFLKAGFAYVPDAELVSLVVTRFRASLSRNLSRLGLALVPRLADEGARLLPLLSGLSKRYLGNDDYSTKKPVFGAVSSVQVGDLARTPGLFPPCMSHLHEALAANHHLRHWGRMQYGLFLKVSVQIRSAFMAFSRESGCLWMKHSNSGATLSLPRLIQTNFRSSMLIVFVTIMVKKVISFSQPATGEFHGCPFRHLDPELLHQRLSIGGKIPSDQVEVIVKRSKDKQYQLACREFFKAMHPDLSVEDASTVAINHPNQYYELAQKAIKGIPLTSNAETVSSQRSRVKVRAVKVPLNDSQMTSQSTGFEDTSIDDEISKIDSTLLEYAGSNLDF
ncbi:unnamed protein product [Rodentolepis nana]|uniref:DNA primase large subunit n=1 Tax=Rodentolepis nana TaxID=102285 RepID=A0A0R3TBQ6_RODNA|nr:unnamed protein product [Rodentolepis nana]